MEVFFIIVLGVGIPVTIAWCLDYKIIGSKRRPKPVEKPVEDFLPMPVFRDIEEIAKVTPEFKQHRNDLMAKSGQEYGALQQWQKDFEALVIATCRHEYDHAADVWYRCTKCKQEQHWWYSLTDHRECVCVKSIEDVKSPSGYNSSVQYVLRFRSGVCKLHGRDYEKYWKDRREQYEIGYKQALEYEEKSWETKIQPGPMFSMGGLITTDKFKLY